jgi:hypothetical protein
MKITPSQLKKIIAEEVQKVINEGMDPLSLIDNQLNGDPDLANKVLVSMVSGLPYMQAIEVIKMLSEKMPGKFDKSLKGS